MLQGIQNIQPALGQYSSVKTPSLKINSSPTFAVKGEPTYEKDMDLDKDGKITFDEFKQYCQENNISSAEQQKMLDDWSKWRLFKSRNTYAEKGDVKYDEEMDEDSDSVVTYDEYVRYQEKQAENDKNSSDKDDVEIDRASKDEDEEVSSKDDEEKYYTIEVEA